MTHPVLEVLRLIKSLDMQCQWCGSFLRPISDIGLELVFDMLPHLRMLSINFTGCDGLRDVKELGEGFGKMQQLQQLTLDLQETKVSSVKELGEGFGKMQQLQQLTLTLGDGTLIRSVKDLP